MRRLWWRSSCDTNRSYLFTTGLPTDIVGSQNFQDFSNRQTPHLGVWWGELTTTTWSSDRCRGLLGSVFISFGLGGINVGGLTWRQVDTSNLRFHYVDGFAWLSNIWTVSLRHKFAPSLAGVRLTQLFPRDGVLDFLFFMFPYILWQFGFVFVAFIFERPLVIVVPNFEVVSGYAYVAWCVVHWCCPGEEFVVRWQRGYPLADGLW